MTPPPADLAEPDGEEAELEVQEGAVTALARDLDHRAFTLEQETGIGDAGEILAPFLEGGAIGEVLGGEGAAQRYTGR